MRVPVSPDLMKLLVDAQLNLEMASARLDITVQAALAATALTGHKLTNIDTNTNELIVEAPAKGEEDR